MPPAHLARHVAHSRGRPAIAAVRGPHGGPEFARTCELLLSAHELAQSLARPGVRVSTSHATVNDHLRADGSPITPYGTGHGVGLLLVLAVLRGTPGVNRYG